MSSSLKLRLKRARKARFALSVAFVAFALVAASSCRSPQESNLNAPKGVIVVNAPAAGEVRRVLVGEGVHVQTGAPIVEIVVRDASQSSAPNRNQNPEQRAEQSVRATNAEIEAARAEVVRHEAEIQRLTPLVSAGQAAQGELDAERALYQRAQQRLQQAQEAQQRAQTALLEARQPGASSAPVQTERIIQAKASAAGTVKIISVRAGDRVTQGQPLATLSSD